MSHTVVVLDACTLYQAALRDVRMRLPTGIFYAQGVKTNVLFFSFGTINKSFSGRLPELLEALHSGIWNDAA